MTKKVIIIFVIIISLMGCKKAEEALPEIVYEVLNSYINATNILTSSYADYVYQIAAEVWIICEVEISIDVWNIEVKNESGDIILVVDSDNYQEVFEYYSELKFHKAQSSSNGWRFFVAGASMKDVFSGELPAKAFIKIAFRDNNGIMGVVEGEYPCVHSVD